MGKSKDSLSLYSLFVVIIACLSGFLFGYYMAIISGAIIFMSPELQFSLAEESAFVSMILFGAMMGSCLGGYITDRFGRKKAFFITTLLLIFGSFLITQTSSYFFLMVARTLQGLSIGIISVLVPLYLGEIAQVKYRGAIVSSYQLIMGFGILTAYLVNYELSLSGNWQMMFLIGLIPAVIQGICLFLIPESPVWLFEKGLKKRAESEGERLQLPQSCYSSQEASKKMKGKRSFVFLIVLGVILSAFQQFTGVNTVIYYAPRIFQEAGYTSTLSALLATISLGLANLIGTLLSVWLLDKVGRRKLLLVGIGGTLVSLASLSLLSFSQIPMIENLSAILLIVYLLFFAIGPGPVVWVLLSEIYPPHIRDRAMTLSLLANWFSVYLILLTFPYLLSVFKISGTFGLYSFFNLLAFLFVFKFFPETKQKTFEEIYKLFKK